MPYSPVGFPVDHLQRASLLRPQGTLQRNGANGLSSGQWCNLGRSVAQWTVGTGPWLGPGIPTEGLGRQTKWAEYSRYSELHSFRPDCTAWLHWPCSSRWIQLSWQAMAHCDKDDGQVSGRKSYKHVITCLLSLCKSFQQGRFQWQELLAVEGDRIFWYGN